MLETPGFPIRRMGDSLSELIKGDWDSHLTLLLSSGKAFALMLYGDGERTQRLHKPEGIDRKTVAVSAVVPQKEKVNERLAICFETFDISRTTRFPPGTEMAVMQYVLEHEPYRMIPKSEESGLKRSDQMAIAFCGWHQTTSAANYGLSSFRNA